MAKTTMHVVLQDDVENLGRAGELVRVKPGYARNYLLPRGLAAVATRGNVAQIEHAKAVALKRAAKLSADAKSRAAALEGTRVEISAKAGDSGKLFGSVGAKDIAVALEAKGIEIDRKRIVLDEPIKDVGEHDVVIKLGHDAAATLKVNVVAA